MDKKSNIFFLLSHQPNPRFVKQINYLSHNHNVSVVYFYRDYMKDLTDEYRRNRILDYNLGVISNGNYLRRIGNYFKSIKVLYKILNSNQYDILFVNNVDILALFKLCTLFKKINTKIVLEISDLRSHTYVNNIKSKIIRNIEKLMFKYIDKLIVTSPKFYDLYYNRLFKDKPFLLENKLLSNMIPKRVNKTINDKIVVGIVGLLLQGRPYETLFKAIKDDERYEVHIYGKGTYQDLIEKYEYKYENIKYFRAYNFFKDSATIYASLDILYMPYDTTNGSLNNKIALPNKFYEAMYFKIPIITSCDTYLSELVEKYSIGKSTLCCEEKELKDSLKKVIENRDLYEKSLKNLDEKLYIGDDDYKRLEAYIAQD